jgi:hypothetical protein
VNHVSPSAKPGATNQAGSNRTAARPAVSPSSPSRLPVGPAHTVPTVLSLQHSVGNRVVSRMLATSTGVVQRGLSARIQRIGPEDEPPDLPPEEIPPTLPEGTGGPWQPPAPIEEPMPPTEPAGQGWPLDKLQKAFNDEPASTEPAPPSTEMPPTDPAPAPEGPIEPAPETLRSAGTEAGETAAETGAAETGAAEAGAAEAAAAEAAGAEATAAEVGAAGAAEAGAGAGLGALAVPAAAVVGAGLAGAAVGYGLDQASNYIGQKVTGNESGDYHISTGIGNALTAVDQTVSSAFADKDKPEYQQTLGWKLANWMTPTSK